ncbi:MAG: mandelate racemase/muconate lactonizing protein [Dehalococcoidia bacterium]|nr:mandelate racemase/muconate lactonizing protein [Dehalococcoidia bacterium]MSQ35144.1 mandelate racemase/muconate lactonizing protein [Dehalococcoidia bacterium]
MKITEVKLRKLTGTMETKGPLWEDRLVQPIDIYPEYRQRGTAGWTQQKDPNHYTIVAHFVEIKTDEGVTGIGGPITDIHAYIIAKTIAPIILGKDPLATELIWDQVHRLMVHGRQGESMMAFSAVDCALWDLKGRYYKTPVYKLLGGPTRSEVPAYSSMLGWNVTDMGLVRERALAAKAQGYTAQKWFFRYGPMSGVEGMKKNVALAKTVREAIGDEDAMMLDCWQSWNYPYAIAAAEMLREYRPYWLEEIAMPDRIDTYAEIRAKIGIPLSGAEHEYTRWGFKRFIDAKALDFLQPDIYWAGGLSEVLKIAHYATVHDLITIPHGHSSPAGIHFSLAQSPIHTPYQEYLVKWNDVHQHFLKNPVKPVNGMITSNELPGLGMDLDPAKIEKEEEVKV